MATVIELEQSRAHQLQLSTKGPPAGGLFALVAGMGPINDRSNDAWSGVSDERQQMTYFLCKMILPRSDFIQTMTDSERNIMKAHGDYLQNLAEVGSIVCHGPVDDPKGGWGLSIFSAKNQIEVERLTAADPIILDDIGARYEILPMKQLRMKGAS